MDFVANIGCPDILLNHNGEDEWLYQGRRYGIARLVPTNH